MRGKSRRGIAQRVALFAVFAVLAGNYQPSTSRSPQKSWAADGSAGKITAKCSLFLRCFSQFFTVRGGRGRGSHHHRKPSKRVDRGSRMAIVISEEYLFVNLINPFWHADIALSDAATSEPATDPLVEEGLKINYPRRRIGQRLCTPIAARSMPPNRTVGIDYGGKILDFCNGLSRKRRGDLTQNSVLFLPDIVIAHMISRVLNPGGLWPLYPHQPSLHRPSPHPHPRLPLHARDLAIG